MQKDHIVHAFDAELQQLDTLIAQMGALAQQQQINALTSFLDNDCKEAKRVAKADKKIDQLEQDIITHATQIFALRQPMAADLRTLVASFKIASNLERIGDHAKNLAKRTKRVGDIPILAEVKGSLEIISSLTIAMTGNALEAYAERSTEKALAVLKQDEDVDRRHKSLIREVLTYMIEDPASITAGTELLFIVKNIERAGDHATNIAEQVYYIITGRYIDAGRDITGHNPDDATSAAP